jgi:phage gp29-like protein
MYLFKNYAVKDWVAFAEVFGMPLRIGKYEPGATKADREALIQAETSTLYRGGLE